MSTYTALGCSLCKTLVSFVSIAGGRPIWMADSETAVPAFVEQHFDHLSALTIVQEADDRYDDWADVTEASPEPQPLPRAPTAAT